MKKHIVPVPVLPSESMASALAKIPAVTVDSRKTVVFRFHPVKQKAVAS